MRPKSVTALHEADVMSVSVEIHDAEANGWTLDFWLNTFTRERGKDIYRLKGLVALKGEPNKRVFQGVHSMLDFHEGSVWKEGEARRSVLVAIGKNLDEALIRETFSRCFQA
jgi:G3E family GTPase